MCSNIVIDVTPPFAFNMTRRGLSCHKCKKKFCHLKMLTNFQILIAMGGEEKPCIIKLLLYLAKSNMETYYPCT